MKKELKKQKLFALIPYIGVFFVAILSAIQNYKNFSTNSSNKFKSVIKAFFVYLLGVFPSFIVCRLWFYFFVENGDNIVLAQLTPIIGLIFMYFSSFLLIMLEIVVYKKTINGKQ